jgi:putative hydrolase of the HAD superfamily
MAKNNRTLAVLFDLEDTLIQTPWSDFQRVLEFRRKTREKLIELGTPPSVLQGIERATLMRNKAYEYVDKNFSKAEAQKFHRALGKFFSQYELDSAKKSKLFTETIPTLEELRGLGAKIGLVTNTSMKAVETVFRLHSLERYFDVVVTRENVKKLKPDPEGIMLAVKTLGVKDFLMVGDLIFDVLAAKSADGKAVFVRRSPQETSDPPADYIVQSLTEIPRIVQADRRKSDAHR